MLGEPRVPVYAYYAPSKTKDFFDKATYPGAPGVIELELWRHHVPLMDGKINPLALYLSLKDNKDERVQNELAKVLEEIKW